MSRANLPRQQAQAVATMIPFAAHISADPSRYGLTVLDAADLQAAMNAWWWRTRPVTRRRAAARGRGREGRRLRRRRTRATAAAIRWSSGMMPSPPRQSLPSACGR